MDERDNQGRFAPGNPGGPGRPPRPVERCYLAALADSVTLDDWRAICLRAVVDAKAGDATARAWLARYLLGDKPLSLVELAADEAGGLGAAAEVEALGKWRADGRMLAAVIALADEHQRRRDGADGTATGTARSEGR